MFQPLRHTFHLAFPSSSQIEILPLEMQFENASFLEVVVQQATRKSTRITNVLPKLRDFDCNNVWTSAITHSSSAYSTSLDLSGKSLYPITQFVNYNNFSCSHQHFLATVTGEIEPTRYSEAVSHLK